MRSYRLIALAIVSFIGISTVTVSARPRKVDYHPAVCQKGPVLGDLDGSGVAPSLSYGNMTVGPVGADITAICPLEHITFGTDTSTGPYWLTITVNAQTPASSAAGSNCNLQIEAPLFSSLPTSAFPGSGASGQPTAAAYEYLPALSTTGPLGMRLLCNLMNGATIGSIELEID